MANGPSRLPLRAIRIRIATTVCMNSIASRRLCGFIATSRQRSQRAAPPNVLLLAHPCMGVAGAGSQAARRVLLGALRAAARLAAMPQIAPQSNKCSSFQGRASEMFDPPLLASDCNIRGLLFGGVQPRGQCTLTAAGVSAEPRIWDGGAAASARARRLIGGSAAA